MLNISIYHYLKGDLYMKTSSLQSRQKFRLIQTDPDKDDSHYSLNIKSATIYVKIFRCLNQKAFLTWRHWGLNMFLRTITSGDKCLILYYSDTNLCLKITLYPIAWFRKVIYKWMFKFNNYIPRFNVTRKIVYKWMFKFNISCTLFLAGLDIMQVRLQMKCSTS